MTTIETQIHTLVVHKLPHQDEDLSICLAQRFARECGINVRPDADVRFMSAKNRLEWSDPDVRRLMLELGWEQHNLPCELSADELEKHGVLFIGTGGGRLDEHPRMDAARGDNVSCARLLSDTLGDELPATLVDLVDYIDNEDTRARRPIPDPLEMSALIRVLKDNGVAHPRVLQLMNDVIDGRIRWSTDTTPLDLYDERLLNVQVIMFLRDTYNDGMPLQALTALDAIEELGLAKAPELNQLIQYLKSVRTRAEKTRAAESGANESRNGGGRLLMYELGTLPRLLYGTPGVEMLSCTPMPLVQWLLAEKHAEQARFHGPMRTEYDRVKDVRVVRLINGKKLKIVFIETSMYGLDRCARFFDKAGIIVIRNPETGNVQVMSSLKRLQKLGIGRTNSLLNQHSHLDEAMKVIRITERQLNGRTIVFDPREIRAEGTIRGAEVWWVDRRFPAGLNGSRSAPDTPATLIPWDELKRLIVTAYDPAIMAGSCQATGRCDHFDCPLSLYGLYLNRCYDLRQGVCGSQPTQLNMEDLVFSDDYEEEAVMASTLPATMYDEFEEELDEENVVNGG